MTIWFYPRVGIEGFQVLVSRCCPPDLVEGRPVFATNLFYEGFDRTGDPDATIDVFCNYLIKSILKNKLFNHEERKDAIPLGQSLITDSWRSSCLICLCKLNKSNEKLAILYDIVGLVGQLHLW